LRLKRAAALGQCHVDVGLWGGAIPGNEADREGLHEAGVLGFKCFTVACGSPESPPLDAAGLEQAAAQLARLDSLLIVHAEDALAIAKARPPGGRDYAGFLPSRPDE